MKLESNSRVLNRHYLKGCEEGNAYVCRNAQRGCKWNLYFTDKKTKGRYWKTLKESDGRFPSPTLDGLLDAERLGTRLYFELKSKTDRGEKTKTLSIRKMVDKYLKSEKKRINPLNNPHDGITKETYYREEREINHYLRFVRDKEWGLGRSDNSAIHLMDINHLDTYFDYRRKTTNEFDDDGKPLPRKATIKTEIFSIIRMYTTIGRGKKYIGTNQIPLVPKDNMTLSRRDVQDTRRESFDKDEWNAILNAGKNWFQHGLSRFDKNGDLYGFEKNENGELDYSKPIRKTMIFGKGNSQRAKYQMIHNKMVYLGMRISMATGLRIGVLKQIKWSNILEIPKRSSRDPKNYVVVKVQSEISKNGNYFEIPAPIAEFLNEIKKISKHTESDDFIFSNQRTGKKWSERIWKEALVDMMMEADLADRKKVDKNGKKLKTKAMIVRSGKKITWYSFRHSFITFKLKTVKLHKVATYCDTSIPYIDKHYYHPDLLSEESINDMEKGTIKRSKKLFGFKQVESDINELYPIS